jgi:hypothetical protein
MLKEVKQFIKDPKTYVRDKWNYMDITLYVLFIVLLVLKFAAIYKIQKLNFDEHKNQYRELQSVLYYQRRSRDLTSVLIVICWARLLGYIR